MTSSRTFYWFILRGFVQLVDAVFRPQLWHRDYDEASLWLNGRVPNVTPLFDWIIFIRENLTNFSITSSTKLCEVFKLHSRFHERNKLNDKHKLLFNTFSTYSWCMNASIYYLYAIYDVHRRAPQSIFVVTNSRLHRMREEESNKDIDTLLR